MHLSYAANDFVLQVSDRKVTYPSGHPFDDLSNKNIIYWARDALVSIGYTGMAYLENTPTDQWLVEKLSGHPYDTRIRPDLHIMGNKVLEPWRNIGQTLRLFRSELGRACSQARAPEQQYFLALAIVGWRLKWKRKSQFVSSPFVAEVIKAAGSASVRVLMPPRRWYLGQMMMWETRRGHLTLEERHQLGDGLSIAHTDSLTKADYNEQVFTEAIRSVSARSPGVGPDCMSTLIPPPKVGWIRVRYIPNESSPAHSSVAYSPWIVGPRNILAPSVMRGTGWNIPLGQFSVVLEGPQMVPPDDRVISWESQTRPKPPR